MDFNPTARQAEVRDSAREFAHKVLAPAAGLFEADEEVPKSIYRGLAERRLMGVNIDAEAGGAAAGTVAYSLAMTEVAAGCASTAVTMAVTNMVGEVIAHFGSDEQRARYNPLLCSGTHGAFALSEVDAGSDPGGMRTTATLDGDHYILNGSKQWISHADTSGVLVVWARTGGGGPKGLSCFLVDGDASGLSVAKHEDKMGLRASHTCAIAFDEVRIPRSALLAQIGGGFPIAMMALDGGRIGIASQALGIGEAAYAAARDHLKQRGADQGASFALADMRTLLDAARLLTLRAAALKEAGRGFSREASMAKVFTTENAWKVANLAVDLLGEHGDLRSHCVERHLRDVRVTMIYEGTSEVQRIVIGRHVTR